LRSKLDKEHSVGIIVGTARTAGTDIEEGTKPVPLSVAAAGQRSP